MVKARGWDIYLASPKLSECKSFIYYIDDTHKTNYNYTGTELGQNHWYEDLSCQSITVKSLYSLEFGITQRLQNAVFLW